MSTPNESDYTEEVAGALEQEACVFLLGPELAVADSGLPLQAALLEHLRTADIEVEIDVHGLFRCSDRERNRAYVPLIRFFSDHLHPGVIHQKLALIPGHVFVSLSPDTLLREALQDAGIAYDFSFYQRGRAQEDLAAPKRERPLLFNLFGTAASRDSLVLTHENLLNFLFSIIKDYPPPKQLYRAVSSAVYFVFLGFDFDKWYLYLLLKIFGLAPEKPAIASEVDPPGNAAIREFYRDHYGMIFVGERVEEWVDLLTEKCEVKGLLREKSEPLRESLGAQLRKRVKKDELAEALEEMQAHLEREGMEEELDEVVATAGELEELKINVDRNRVSKDEARVEKSRLRDVVLHQIRDLEERSGAA